MATFEANPDSSNEPWIEKAAIVGSPFRIWHLMFFSFCAFASLVVLICCCVKLRVPRTKQEIEADYHRKKLAEKFKKRLRLINNQEMDAIDLQKALEIIQQDYKNENKTYYDLASFDTVNYENEKTQNLNIEDAVSPQTSNFKRTTTNIINSAKFCTNQVSCKDKENIF